MTTDYQKHSVTTDALDTLGTIIGQPARHASHGHPAGTYVTADRDELCRRSDEILARAFPDGGVS